MALLTPLNNNFRKYKLCGFDTETYLDSKKNSIFIMGSVYWDSGYRIFWNKIEMRNFLISKKFRGYRLYAVNLMFDFFVLFDDWQQLVLNSILFMPIIRGSLMINSKFKNGKDCYNFCDTLAVAPLSVKNMGKLINMDKLEPPLYLGTRKPLEEEKEYLEKYNLRDSEITYKFMLFFQNGINELGTDLKLTIASTSLSLFRRKYLDCPLIQPEQEERDFIRSGYSGGRTEVFIRGYINNVNDYDVNSLYPYVMYKNKYPNPNYREFIKHGILDNILKHEGFTKVKINCPNMNIPLLPFKMKDKLLFPIGTFESVYSHIELRKALELGYKILEIKEQLYYTKTINLFYKFVNTLYKLRKEYKKNKNPMQEIVKLILNSLYGKFAQKEEKDSIAFLGSKEALKLYENEGFDLNEETKIIKGKVKSVSSFMLPELSAYTTSYARLHLYSFFEKLKETPLYCDTDSIFTCESLPTGEELGELKLEKHFNFCLLVKPKFYLADNELIKIKGINKATLKDFNNALEGKTISKEKFVKFKESLVRHFCVNQLIHSDKDLDLEDNKRKWQNKFCRTKKEESKPIKI